MPLIAAPQGGVVRVKVDVRAMRRSQQRVQRKWEHGRVTTEGIRPAAIRRVGGLELW